MVSHSHSVTHCFCWIAVIIMLRWSSVGINRCNHHWMANLGLDYHWSFQVLSWNQWYRIGGFEWPYTTKLQKPREWDDQKVSGNFRAPHFTPCLVRMPRNNIEYSSKAQAKSHQFTYKNILVTKIQRMSTLSPEDSTLSLFHQGKNLQTMLLVLYISFSSEKGQLDLFPSFMGPQDLLDVGSPLSFSWFPPVIQIWRAGAIEWSTFYGMNLSKNFGESVILWILLGTPSLIIGAYPVHTLFSASAKYLNQLYPWPGCILDPLCTNMLYWLGFFGLQIQWQDHI